ncbi:MAG: glycosyltransferase family 39 protein [Bacteroidetes bacterium]|nr:glycosyltransferase family 39 protein [Bacteroidota bacterium]
MNKLQNIVNNKWFPVFFLMLAVFVSIFQHYRVFSLDIIGYHSWRQTQTQMVIDNFAKHDFNILNPRMDDLHYPDGIYRMEFPLAQWLIAALYKLFGSHLYITRLFFYATTFISAIGMYQLIQALTHTRLTALLTAWFFLFSPVIYYYSVNPLPDNLALCFGIWSLYFWIKHLHQEQVYWLILSAVFLSLSVAVKLPFIVFAAIYLSKLYDRTAVKKIHWKYCFIPFIMMLPTLIWYGWVIPTWSGNGVVKGILDNDKTLLQLLSILQFNLVSSLPELLVNYATFPLFVIGFYMAIKQLSIKSTIHRTFIYVGISLIGYFLYEMHLIDKVHDYYLFPFLPVLFVIVALAVQTILFNKKSNLKYLVLLSFLVCPVTAYLRCNTRWNSESPGFTKEFLTYKHQLQSIIPPTAKVIVCGDGSRSIVLYHLQRKGYSLGDNEITDNNVEQGLKNGATFLITDCNTDTNQVMKRHTYNLLFKKNKVKLFLAK